MTAGERRILSIEFLGKSTWKVMTQDHETMRVGRFERTGCLLTFITNHGHDQRIKQQGMMASSFTVFTQSAAVGGDNENENINILAQSVEEVASVKE